MRNTNSSRSFGAYIKDNKGSIIVVSIIVAAVIIVSIVLGVVLSDTFRIGRIEKISVGDTLEFSSSSVCVERVMGIPDIETDEYCEYYESSVVDDIKAVKDALEKGNLKVAERRAASLQGKTFKYVRITLGYQEFDGDKRNNRVSEVFYDAKCKFYEGKLVHGKKKVKEYELSHLYDDYFEVECIKTVSDGVVSYVLSDDARHKTLQYTTKFTDGSYIRAIADVSLEVIDDKPYLVWSDRFATYKNSSLLKIVSK